MIAADQVPILDKAERQLHRAVAAGALGARFSLMRARRNSREPQNALSIPNTERGFGGKPLKKSRFRRHLAGSKMPKETFFTAISRWRVVSWRMRSTPGTVFQYKFYVLLHIHPKHLTERPK